MKFKIPGDEVYSLKTVVHDVIMLRDEAFKKEKYGPFCLHMSRQWEEELDSDYIIHPTAGPVTTLRERILQIGYDSSCAIVEVIVVDYLPPWSVVLYEKCIESNKE
jgi:hypothetical protein